MIPVLQQIMYIVQAWDRDQLIRYMENELATNKQGLLNGLFCLIYIFISTFNVVAHAQLPKMCCPVGCHPDDRTPLSLNQAI